MAHWGTLTDPDEEHLDEYGWSTLDLATAVRRNDVVSLLRQFPSPPAEILDAAKSASQESPMRWRIEPFQGNNDLYITDLEVKYISEVNQESSTLFQTDDRRVLVQVCRPFPLPNTPKFNNTVPSGYDEPTIISSPTGDKPEIYFEITVLQTDRESQDMFPADEHAIPTTVTRIVGLGLTNAPLHPTRLPALLLPGSCVPALILDAALAARHSQIPCFPVAIPQFLKG
ncbi:hypothetical protein BZA77DRAFT_391832 [Pyronema omphalodes]|nr:hypothetical protein BZA77DRAFT_391832 [Pyronema omphalodes]